MTVKDAMLLEQACGIKAQELLRRAGKVEEDESIPLCDKVGCEELYVKGYENPMDFADMDSYDDFAAMSVSR